MPGPGPGDHADNTLIHGLSYHLDRLPGVWRAAFQEPAARTGLELLSEFLDQRLAQRAVIYPRFPFRALDNATPEDIKVVILGQDPYHGANQAQGLAFSVPDICPCPPSLRNILTEVTREYPDQLRGNGHDLSSWARQGVLLLNAVLTVEAGRPASHANKGWEAVTDAILQRVAQTATPTVFMLWGAYAQRKQALLEHSSAGPACILTANHPSPLSARRPPKPFIGSGHFRAANAWLKDQGVTPVNWLGL